MRFFFAGCPAMSLEQAPVLRGPIEDFLPADLRELVAWLNAKLPEHHRPLCPICHSRCWVLYAPGSPGSMWWACKMFEHGILRKTDTAKLLAYTKRRLGHRPRDYFPRS